MGICNAVGRASDFVDSEEGRRVVVAENKLLKQLGLLAGVILQLLELKKKVPRTDFPKTAPLASSISNPRFSTLPSHFHARRFFLIPN